MGRRMSEKEREKFAQEFRDAGLEVPFEKLKELLKDAEQVAYEKGRDLIAEEMPASKQTPCAIGTDMFRLFMAKQKGRDAIRAYEHSREQRERDMKDYAGKLLVLRLHPNAGAGDVEYVCDLLQEEYGKREILFDGDRHIKRLQPELEAHGFYFFENWTDKGSPYRQILQHAKERGQRFEMVHEEKWSYRKLT